ncbi:uncharacterized protein [Miscanthus floridulus]|uniref:uncharacterized protein isoform X1 n=1 Tax=Miscanthus floridulus TaxID=154761 RepID=UPI003458BADA
MAAGSDPASPASVPPPPPKQRKIDPPRRFRVRCQRELISTNLETQSDLLSFKRSMRGALEAMKASIPSLGITLFLSSQRTTSLIRARPSQVTLDKDKSVASSNSSSIPGSLPARVDLNKLREAKRFAVLQAQHEGCRSYESFDSLFGNYLVPVIPTNDFFDQVGTKP